MRKHQRPETDETQLEKFKAMAKELEADGDEKSFDAKLIKLAKKKKADSKAK